MYRSAARFIELPRSLYTPENGRICPTFSGFAAAELVAPALGDVPPVDAGAHAAASAAVDASRNRRRES